VKKWVQAFVMMAPAVAGAGELSSVAGRYDYQQYSVTMPDGRSLQLRDLGAKSATLDISDAGTVTLRMVMAAGPEVVQTAKVMGAKVSPGGGYWLAQWPDMSYPVRAEFTVSGGKLSYVIRFDNQADMQRHGMTERATLVKAGEKAVGAAR
jgi:hypothetical protein